MFMAYLCIKLYMPTSNSSLVTAIKLRGTEKFDMFCLLVILHCAKYYLNKFPYCSQTYFCTVHLCCLCSHLENLHALHIISDCRKLNIKDRVILQRHNFHTNFCVNLLNNYKAEMAGTSKGFGYVISPCFLGVK
jgi:hypothetical protein